MAKNPELSVIIPAYNEIANFKAGKLGEVHNYLKLQTYDWEVLVVDDGSTDDTATQVGKWVKNKPGWRLIKNHHSGKSETILRGFKEAKGRVQLFTDFDHATPISYVEQVFQKVAEGYDVVIGSREIKGAIRYHEPLSRHLIGRAFNLIVQVLALRGISDSQCGFKAFTKPALADLLAHLVVYKNQRKVADAYFGALDVELLFLARKLGYKTAQIPVKWTYVKSPRLNAVKNSTRMFIDILKIRLAYLSGKYR